MFKKITSSLLRLQLLLFLAKYAFVLKHKSPKNFLGLNLSLNNFLEYTKSYSLKFSETFKPVSVDIKDRNIEVHTLLCKRDLHMYLWAIRSLIYYLKLDCPIVVHDDGSLEETDIQLLRKSLPGITIITKSTSDSEVGELLKDYPACQAYREQSIWGVKLFDYNLLSNADWILSFDSDILFFAEGKELKEGMEEKNLIFYNKEYENDVYNSDPFLVEKYPYIIGGFNAGLFFYPKTILELEGVEKITYWLQKNAHKINFPYFRIDDQIVYSILTGSQKSAPLDPKYSTSSSSKILKQQLICKHFHSAWKDGFWLEGIAALLKKKPSFINLYGNRE